MCAARLVPHIFIYNYGYKMKIEEIRELIKLMQEEKVGILKLGNLELHLAEFPEVIDDIEDKSDDEDILFYSSEG